MNFNCADIKCTKLSKLKSKKKKKIKLFLLISRYHIIPIPNIVGINIVSLYYTTYYFIQYILKKFIRARLLKIRSMTGWTQILFN